MKLNVKALAPRAHVFDFLRPKKQLVFGLACPPIRIFIGSSIVYTCSKRAQTLTRNHKYKQYY